MKPVDVRSKLTDALRLDLIGPGEVLGITARTLGQLDEILSQRPSTWYLSGFLVPFDADPDQKTDLQADDDLDEQGDSGGGDDSAMPEPAAARVRYLPSSMGASLLIPPSANQLNITVRWGDYRAREAQEGEPGHFVWVRTPREQQVTFSELTTSEVPLEQAVPGSDGLYLALSVRPLIMEQVEGGLPQGVRCVSVFLVNRRTPQPEELRDQAFAFQTQLEIHSAAPIVARPDLRSLVSNDWDERVADLQFHDAYEFAVGHSVATEALVDDDGHCHTIRTCWIPSAEVERVAPSDIPGVELAMDALAELADASQAHQKLDSFVSEYRRWIAAQQQALSATLPKRQETASLLFQRAAVAANRIEQGIALLDQPLVLDVFRITNRVMAQAARRRLGVMQGHDPAAIQPKWRPFQLAFLLMNLPGIVHPEGDDREVVDLLFFPTGGGKTEAYLGLAAFTLLLRRLQNPGISSAGVSVLMRYTLRLLTLDQLGRAATLICALELERQNDVEKFGPWPFEIGLWVGQAATPNVMGAKGDNNSESARARTIAYQRGSTNTSPIPLEDCPWCGTKFSKNSFQLLPKPDYPTDLRVLCANRHCEFSRDHSLPILAVDEPIYRRLPCFMIATVDKFAAMPWTGEVGQFFGRVQRHDAHGFYGPCDTSRGAALPNSPLLPPDLIIQDELHLISGPLGTVVGLYETALNELCCREVQGRKVRPKIIASTATVRRAESQIRALFHRGIVDIFPPPGPDRRDSFFAETHSTAQSHARLYLGVAAQGRSPKVVMLRVYLALLAAAQQEYDQHPQKKDPANPADPYMTLVGYFNSLRELGGARRLVEDEIGNRLLGYGNRQRVTELERSFADRKIAYEVLELTSRVSTDKVSHAKRRLAKTFSDGEHVDVALATNMISVGLDITRLGLMVVFGQPKSSAEYIQATSRVGRDHDRPGLVVTVLNVHKPRDRSHYERFAAYHQSFYRNVEATSVTPFSPRALDRGLAGTLVAMARHGVSPMTAPAGAMEILRERGKLDFAIEALVERAGAHNSELPTEESELLRQRVRDRALDLLDEWAKIAKELNQVGGRLQYQKEIGGAQRLLYEFLNPDLKQLPIRYEKFRANRSMRDVEPSVNLRLKRMDGTVIDEENE
jgi:hypothetical protein